MSLNPNDATCVQEACSQEGGMTLTLSPLSIRATLANHKRPLPVLALSNCVIVEKVLSW